MSYPRTGVLKDYSKAIYLQSVLPVCHSRELKGERIVWAIFELGACAGTKALNLKPIKRNEIPVDHCDTQSLARALTGLFEYPMVSFYFFNVLPKINLQETMLLLLLLFFIIYRCCSVQMCTFFNVINTNMFVTVSVSLGFSFHSTY